MSPSIETLGDEQSGRLKELEATIDAGLRAFVRVGTALAEIRDDQLHLADYPTFAAYCEGRWELSRSRAYQLIEAAEIARLVSKKLDGKAAAELGPRNDAQARALAPLKDQPEKMVEALQEATFRAEGHPTAQNIQEAVERRVTPPEPEPESDTLEGPADPPPPPTHIEEAVRHVLPDDEGTHHYTVGQLERLHEIAGEADHTVICVRPTGRANGELEVSWKAEGERRKEILNRHGNSPEGTAEVA